MAGIVDMAKADIEKITGDINGYGKSMTFTSNVGTPPATATVIGTTARHHQSFDTDGVKVSSRNIHVSVAEKQFIAAGYPIRNVNGDVAIQGHRVAVADSTGTVKNYVVREQYPDETIGLIVLILGAYA
jgi:hypothetical protein